MAANREGNPPEIVPSPSPNDVRVRSVAQRVVAETTNLGDVRIPFNTQWEMEDFAYLVGIDEGWHSLTDGQTPSLDEMETTAAHERITSILEHPLFPDHVVGYAFSHLHLKEGWVRPGQILSRLCDTYYAISYAHFTQLNATLRTLTDQERLEGAKGAYRVTEHCRQEEFCPELGEEFFDWTVDQLKQRGGRGKPKYLALAYFGETITPHEFWAGMQALGQWQHAGRFDFSRLDGKLCLPNYEDPKKTAFLDLLDGKLKQQEPGHDPIKLEKAMRAAGVVRGPRRLSNRNHWIGSSEEPRETD